MFTKLTYMKRVIIFFLLISFCGGATDSSPPQQQEQQSQESSSENVSQESTQQNATEQSSSSSNQESSSQSQSSGLTLQTLPDIKEFMTNKSDRFFVDFEDIIAGHPYVGKRSPRPHNDAQVYFKYRSKMARSNQSIRLSTTLCSCRWHHPDGTRK